jgi:large subunit ribosomal protein L23
MSLIKNYKTLLQPVVTEKSSMISEHNQVTFKVKVKSVNTIITKGKLKAFRGVIGRRSNYKKAIVTLQEGQSIDMSVGV